MKIKKYLFLFICLSKFSCSEIYAQKIFLDSVNCKTTEELAVYYRIIKNHSSAKDTFVFKDYFLNGVIKSEGSADDNYGFLKKGIYKTYYKNGNIESQMNFLNQKPFSDYTYWYDNDSLKEKGYFRNIDNKKDKPTKIIMFSWDKKNKQIIKNGNGYYVDDSETSFIKGQLKNGIRDSIWEGTIKKYKLNFMESYKDGELIQGTSIDENGDKYYYLDSQVNAEPKYGIKDFYNFIGQNFIMPNVSGLKGIIIAKFFIETDGSINETKIINGISPKADQEAIRVIKKYTGWQPSRIHGKKIRSFYQLPISIKAPN
jgi:hypothetical protein